MKTFKTIRADDGWKTRCELCGSISPVSALSAVAGWQYRHTCSPVPAKGA